MTTSLYNGVNGIKAQSFGIDTIADNISNINAYGFKYSTTGFGDFFSSTTTSQSVNPSQTGNGVYAGTNKLVFEQGDLVSSDGEFDVALEGKGFFGVLGSDGTVYYTRNGAFSRDANGYLVDSSGNFVLGTLNPSLEETTYSDRVASLIGSNLNSSSISSGYIINSTQDFSLASVNAQTQLLVPTNIYLPPVATTSVSFKGGLDSSLSTQTQEFELSDSDYTLDTTENGDIVVSGKISTDEIFSAKEGEKIQLVFTDAEGKTSSVQVVLDENLEFKTDELSLDNLDKDTISVSRAVLYSDVEVASTKYLTSEVINSDGSKSVLQYALSMVLPQTSTNTEYSVVASMLDTENNLIAELGTGSLVFDENGALIQNTLTSVNNPNGQSISVDLGTMLNSNIVGSGYDGVYLLQTSNSSEQIVSSSDGSTEGFYSQYDIADDGSIIAEFTNGKTAVVGKLALYNFMNEEGLASVGGTNFVQTANSGSAYFATKDGEIVNTAVFSSKTLEQSNVDLATQLTNLIIIQKGFDASSKSITTSDEMIQKAINMKQ